MLNCKASTIFTYQFYVDNIHHNLQLQAGGTMKRHVAELIDKIEKLCNEGHQTESVSVHIPSTYEREGPSSHTIWQRQTRRLLSVDEDEALVRTVELLGVGRCMMLSIISVSV